ncbi:uncharacterized protein LOC141825936 [Curcuma longa]|uniref:uncharacterized protein LOC141825936 n=1 Tax=Curcuma longa TaxID=136217 RepID=UPI003D9E66B6
MDSDLHSSLVPLPGSESEANRHGLPLPPPPQPPTGDKRQRRPRARQVSSRYLSPFPSPSSYSSHETLNVAASPRNSSPKIHPIQKSHPSRFSPFHVPSEEVDENQPFTGAVRRSSETPLPGTSFHAKPPGTLKKKAVVRLFADNNHHEAADQPPLARPVDTKRRQRPGTPIAHPAFHPATAIPRAKNRPPTPAQVSLFPYEGSVREGEKRRSEDTSSENSFSDAEICSVSSQGEICDSPPLIPLASSRLRATDDVRSSMPEVDLLPTMSAKRQDAGEDASCRASTNSISLRSLGSALPSRQQQHPLNLSKSVSRPLFSLKPPQPQPPCAKPVTGSKKVPKSSARQEDIHMLRLLDNSYMQWRFINAKARATEEAKRVIAQRSLYGTSTRISELQNSVKEKKVQLEELKRRKNLLSIITHQIAHLGEWNSVEEEYSCSLSGITKALQDASLRLPVAEDVKVDIRELEVVLNSSLLIVESLSSCMEQFQPKAEDIDIGASDLASCIGNERILIEECGNLLSQTHEMQVKECSLRAQLIQAKRSCQ